MNRLSVETSPYLRQHRDNPVDWYAWGPEAFAEAERRDRPILLSVGYSACHWCHVMAHECFEDAETAAQMNELFVNVKVDREERPDVDAVYMDAVQAMTGRGGWPMTVFMTPDGHPFFGGTYFPRPQFHQLMATIDDVWRNRRSDLQQNITAIRERLTMSARITPADAMPGDELIAAAHQHIAQHFDRGWGGFGGAPKFPSTLMLELALRAHAVEPSEGAEQVVTTSLDAMASGGVYDHIGGGFARYSVDERWMVPHFEKMLYDQALQARIYLHAWQHFDRDGSHERWKQVVEEIIGYVLTTLTHASGGFCSAEDADSPDEHGNGHEGLFYLWTPDQVRAAAGDVADAALAWYDVTDEGNFEGRTIPCRISRRGELLRPADVELARQRLFAARTTRRRPGLDDKVLTEWNGLMLATLAEAAAAMQRPDWLAAAIANGEFLLGSLRGQGGRYHRSWQAEGGARHQALAVDYAALIDAFTRLGEASGQARWIDAACEAADQLLDRFWDTDHGGVFTVAEDGEQLVARQKDLMDNPTPSANSLAATALYRLGVLTGEQRYINQADQILRLGAAVAPQAVGAFSQLLAAVGMHDAGLVEVVIIGDRTDMVAAVQRRYLPNTVLAWGEPYDSPIWERRRDGEAYVCRRYACQAPQTTVEGLLAQLEIV